ncbi:addiction module protein [Rheinheimera sp. FR7-31]|uniref:addiction module protein n=1 Tax=Rheinheimera fenheensis TaxID=3152295 RepID=UPI00325F479D
MTTLFEQVLASSKSLTADERARLAHALIASLDQQQDDDAEQQWLAVTEQRVGEIEGGYVAVASWQDIKKQLGKDKAK